MPDPLVLATVLALKIAGGMGWMQKQESLHDIELVASAVWWEARSRGFDAKVQVAYSVLDRGSFHSRSASIPETLSYKAQFPWFAPERIAKREERTSKFSIEQEAWREAVMVATLVYASDEKTPLLKRPCKGNPTMLDAVWNMKKRTKTDKRIPSILAKGCVVDGIVFWNEEDMK